MLIAPRDVLRGDVTALWPLAKILCDETDGRLVGGTALVLYLQHRDSEDIDIHTVHKISGRRLARQIRPMLEGAYGRDHGIKIMLQWAEDDGFSVRLSGTKVDVFRDRRRSRLPRWLEDRPQAVDGVPVAGIPDPLAMKLKAITDRKQLRDYVDLATIDTQTPYSIEDGLRFHIQKYRYDEYPSPPALREVVDALIDHDELIEDPLCERQRGDALSHLRRRHRDVLVCLSEITDAL